MNYTEKEIPYTRIVEHKHFEFGKQDNTVITTPYYPVVTEENKNKYQLYHKEITSDPDIILGGRLGKFCYFDMDQVIGNALSYWP